MLYNANRADEIMGEMGLDGLVASTFENVTYMTGFVSEAARRNRRTQFYGVAPRATRPTLILPVIELCALVSEPLQDAHTVCYGSLPVVISDTRKLSKAEAEWIDLTNSCKVSSSALAALIRELKDTGLAAGRVGFDVMGLLPGTLEAVKEELPGIHIEDATDVFRRIRMIKTPAEVELLRKSAAVNEEALVTLIDLCKSGVTSSELVNAYREYVTRKGAVAGLWTALGGEQSSGFFRPGNRPLKPGDIIRFDLGCSFENYWSDMGRTACIGSASDRLVRIYQDIRAAYEAALDKLQAGVLASEIFHAAVNTFRARDHPDYDRPHCGHGIGVEFYDPPMIAPNDNTPVAPGMVINLEVPYYELGFGGLQIEDTFLIKEGGYEALTSLSWDLFVQ